MADILLVLYIIFMIGYTYLCYGKYDFNYWMFKMKEKMQHG